MSQILAALDYEARSPLDSVETAQTIATALDELMSISQCSTQADLRNWLRQFALSLGFYGCRYIHLGHLGTITNLADTPTPVRYLSTTPSDDLALDERDNWIVCDPAVTHVRSSFTPFPWTTEAGRNATSAQKDWLNRLRARGVNAGLAVPVQDYVSGPAYLSFFGASEATAVRLMEERAMELAFTAAQFHAVGKSLVPVRKDISADAITPRELECLTLVALGRTSQQCGKALGITEKTVEYHLGRLMPKLNAVSRVHAVAIAVARGLVRI